MNYLTKKNLGIPAVVASAMAVIAGYEVYQSIGFALVTLIFVAAVFALDFDDIVKNYTKQSLMLAFCGFLLKIASRVFDSILSWFSASSETGLKVLNVFRKIDQIVFDLGGFVVFALFAVLMLMAISGKVNGLSFLNAKAPKANTGCPNCGAKIENGSAFCTKCGTKF